MAQSDGDERSDLPAAPPVAVVPPFLGTHHPRMDDKGRLFLPAKFRERLAGGLVITPGQERCLYVFPDAEFARLFERIRQAPVTSKRARDYQRMFLARASDETPDKQGRDRPAGPAHLRRPHQGVRRRRRRQPGRGLGRGVVGHLRRRAAWRCG